MDHARQTKDARRTLKFGPPHVTDRRMAFHVLRFEGAHLAPGGARAIHLDSIRGIFGEGAAAPEGLVVRMGRDYQQCSLVDS